MKTQFSRIACRYLYLESYKCRYINIEIRISLYIHAQGNHFILWPLSSLIFSLFWKILFMLSTFLGGFSSFLSPTIFRVKVYRIAGIPFTITAWHLGRTMYRILNLQNLFQYFHLGCRWYIAKKRSDIGTVIIVITSYFPSYMIYKEITSNFTSLNRQVSN